MSELSVEYHAELKRHNYVTPTSYLELIGAFRSLLDKQRGMVTEAKSRYDVGLQKLTETSEQVAGMQAELVELQPKLVLAGKEADELMLKIEVDTKEANVTRANVTKEEAAATKKADEAQAIKIDCEAGLAEALPALEAAVKALKTLKRDDITEVKSMKSPRNPNPNPNPSPHLVAQAEVVAPHALVHRGAHLGDMARYGEIWGDMGRYGEIWGHVGR